jgi:hypothetical protein
VASGGASTAGLTRLRALPRGTLLLGLAILAVMAAVASNIPEDVSQHHLRTRDRQAFLDWAKANGGRRSYGVAVTETHSRYDLICTPHFVGSHRRRDVDYRMYLVVDSHGSGTPRVVRAVKGPIKVKPTATGPKCGALPPGP